MSFTRGGEIWIEYRGDKRYVWRRNHTGAWRLQKDVSTNDAMAVKDDGSICRLEQMRKEAIEKERLG